MFSDLIFNKYLKIIIGVSFILLSTVLNASNEREDSLQSERYRQAGHPATTASIFKDLSRDRDASIRKRVASNRKTPKKILLH